MASLANAGAPALVPPKVRRARGVLAPPALAAIGLAALIASIGPAPSAAQPALQFTRTDYPVGSTPLGVAIGDLNGDGHPDVVVANSMSNTVSRWLGDAAGGLGGRSDFSVGSRPFALALSDLDGNGTLDLAVANTNGSTVTILRGDGLGGFASRSDYPTGVAPLSIAIANLNADGRPDIVTANNGAHTISVLLGTGSGTFAAPVNLPMGQYPYALALGDLNGDGKPDVAAVNFSSNTVSVRFGAGGTSFGPITTFATGVNPTSVAIGDLNGDGKPDLAVANSGANSISVLTGDGFGNFGAKVDYPTGDVPITVATADFNGDAKLDLAVTNRDSNSISVLLANASGGFSPKVDFATGNYCWSLAIRDLNGDGSPDLAVTNSNDAGVSVLLQLDSRSPTSSSLTSDLNPSDLGQTVSFTATVSPSAATGTVRFLDGGQALGTVSLSSGTATFSTSGLQPGTHPITAFYEGDAGYRPSTSPILPQIVRRLASATSVSSSLNPSVFTVPVTFTAVVTAATPGLYTPTGSVQFKVDGVNFGPPVTLSAGHATSQAASALAAGNHAVEALYLGDSAFDPSTSPALIQVVESPNPVIVGVRDVPRDQGGRVFLTWRSRLDQPGFRKVTGYRVWRRAPNLAATRARPKGADRALDGTFWEAIATLPAEQLVSYGFTAATAQDSMTDSNPYTAFFVTALTADPFVYYESAPDSGYSVDNLAPPVPAPFAGVYGLSSTALHWGISPAPDLREFRLYRGLAPEFVPSPANLILATRDTGYVDPAHTAYVYKLAAVDIHGNASHFAVVTPNGPVAALASLAGIEAAADRIRITWFAAGGPGLTATVYRRTAQSDWTALGSIEADGVGYLRYEDLAVQTGVRYGYRLGITDGESEVFVGEAWAVAERQVFSLEGIRPNPAAGGALTVFFSLPSTEPARLELLDVSGRSIVARDVGSLGPGPHTLDLAAGRRVPPGIYLVRLSQRGTTRIVRAAVLN